jgi:hypothetical protein
MQLSRKKSLYGLIGAAWVCTVVFGAYQLWSYESTPSAPAHAPLTWPADTRVSREAGLPTLVMLVHPRCPCTQATIGELAKLMTDCRGKLAATVLVLRPDGVPDGWEQTRLWNDAAIIPGVRVVADTGGEESRRFGAETSGQTLLFSADGRLLFSGGITESRGHSGDNAGRSAIESLVLEGGTLAQAAHTPVYGCPLCNESSNGRKEGNLACPKK